MQIQISRKTETKHYKFYNIFNVAQKVWNSVMLMYKCTIQGSVQWNKFIYTPYLSVRIAKSIYDFKMISFVHLVDF